MLYGREPRLPIDVSLLPLREISPSIAEHRARVVEHIEIAHRIAKENIQRAQQRMKDNHDKHAVPLKYKLGDRVWVYTPKNRKGLSKKLAHNFHGPYRIVQFLSPVHCILRATDNRRISTTVHISRMKPYVDPASRPIREPLEDVDDPFLAEEDLPDDSFLPEPLETHPGPQVPLTEDTDAMLSTGNSSDYNQPQAVSSTGKRVHNTGRRKSSTQLQASASDGAAVQEKTRKKTSTPPQASASASEVPREKTGQPSATPPQSSAPPSNVSRGKSKETAITPSAPSDAVQNGEVVTSNDKTSANDLYQVEKIMKQRTLDGEHQFFIKWLGFPHSQNTWEPASNIIDKRSINKFYKKHPRAKRFDDDPDYKPRVAAFVDVEFPKDVPVIAAFSEVLICSNLDQDISESYQENNTLPAQQDPRVIGHELNPTYKSPLTQNTADTNVLKPLTSDKPLHASVLETSPSLKPRIKGVSRCVPQLGLSPQRTPLTSKATHSAPGLHKDNEPLNSGPLDPNPVSRVTTIFTPRIPVFVCFLLFMAIFAALVAPMKAHGYDATGKKITFFPNALMYATNPKVLIFYNDTKLVNIHTDLNAFPRGQTPEINITCDSVQATFYWQILDSVRGIQRTTHRLLSIPGVTNFLECDSFLRRYYQYETGLASQLFCPTRHFENSLHECKSWAARACRVTSSDELAWLRSRERRSPFMCHMGVFGLFRAMYKLFTRKGCDSSPSAPLVQVLREAGKSLSINQQLTETVNGKVVVLFRTTDLLSSKVKQLISTMRVMDTTLKAWNKQINAEMNKERCHYQANMEFIALYSLQVNRAMSSILRLNEIEDTLRQLSHITRKTVISFAELPRFLTAELEIRLAQIPTMVHTLAALKEGFSLIMEPLVDYEFTANKKMQLSLLFTLPELSSPSALCTIEQLVPITYQNNGKCFATINYSRTL